MTPLAVIAIIEGVAIVVLLCVVDWLLTRIMVLSEKQARYGKHNV